MLNPTPTQHQHNTKLTPTEVNYFNDLHVFDLDKQEWRKVGEDARGDNSVWPSPRSGFGMVEYNDTVVVYGGYCKVSSGPTKDKGVVHSDVWLLDMKSMRWSKAKKCSGSAPTPRCSFSCLQCVQPTPSRPAKL